MNTIDNESKVRLIRDPRALPGNRAMVLALCDLFQEKRRLKEYCLKRLD